MKKEVLRNILLLSSIVIPKKGRKKLMIVGRIQEERSSDILYNYAAALYPEGILDASELYMPQGENIDRIYHIELQEEGKLALRSYVEQKLKGLKLLEQAVGCPVGSEHIRISQQRKGVLYMGQATDGNSSNMLIR